MESETNYSQDTLNHIQFNDKHQTKILIKSKKLKNSYPITKLKIISTDNESEEDNRPHVEIEKTINHRKVNGEVEYLVKWRNFYKEFKGFENKKFSYIIIMTLDFL